MKNLNFVEPFFLLRSKCEKIVRHVTSFAILFFFPLACVLSEPIKRDSDIVCTCLLVRKGVACGYLCVSMVLSIMAAGKDIRFGLLRF